MNKRNFWLIAKDYGSSGKSKTLIRRGNCDNPYLSLQQCDNLLSRQLLFNVLKVTQSSFSFLFNCNQYWCLWKNTKELILYGSKK